MQDLLSEIRTCTICKEKLQLGPNPVLAASEQSKIVIIGQAPGKKVHESGIPWDDKSGDRLREWLGVSKEQFYDSKLIALIPMGFCYPGKGKSGDLPPTAECAPQWHEKLLAPMHSVKLRILIGNYAQGYYLPESKDQNLTERVKAFRSFLPNYVLPHPSPRNNIWLKKNTFFEEEFLPELRLAVSKVMG